MPSASRPVAVLTTSHEWAHPLHVIHMSPLTLDALDAACYDVLLLGGRVPVLAAPEPAVANDTVVAAEWVVNALGDCSAVDLKRVTERGLGDAPHVDLRCVTTGSCALTCDNDDELDSSSDIEDGDAVDAAGSGGGHRSLPCTSGTLGKSCLRAARRQLEGLPVRPGWLLAIQHVEGVRILQVLGSHRGCDECHCIGRTSELVLRDGVCPPPSPRLCLLPTKGEFAPQSRREHSADLLSALRRHAAALLMPVDCAGAALKASPAKARGMDALAAAGRRSGHALICGPRANGKLRALRHLSQWLVRSTDAAVVELGASDLLAAADRGGDGGLSAALDAKLASALLQPPTLVVVRDLNLLATSTSASGGGHLTSGAAPVQQHVAKALLERMRSAPPRVLMVATVTDPSKLPAHLRAHGGFEVTFELPSPTCEQREALLRGWFDKTSGATPGSVSRAMAACEASAPAVVQQGAQEGVLQAGHAAPLARMTTSYDMRELRGLLAAAAVRATMHAGGSLRAATWADVQAASRLVRPSPDVHANIAVSSGLPPARAWERVGGYEPIRARLMRLLELHEANHAAMVGHAGAADGGGSHGGGGGGGGGGGRADGDAASGGAPKPSTLRATAASGALLYGPSGNGKTLLVSCLADASGWPMLRVKGSELFGMYVGDTEAAIRDVFRSARARAPAILVIDEIDAIGGSRGEHGGGGGSSVAERALSTLLNEMDGVGVSGPAMRGPASHGAGPGGATDGAGGGGRSPLFLLACTSRPDLVDAALLRPGRLEQLLYVGAPDMHARERVLRVHTKHLRVAESARLDAIAAQTDRFSCAALAALCREAALTALARAHRQRIGRASASEDDASTSSEDEDEATEAAAKAARGSKAAGEASGDTQAQVRSWGAEGLAAMETDVIVGQQDLERAVQGVRRTQVPTEGQHLAQLAKYARFRAHGVHGASR